MLFVSIILLLILMFFVDCGAIQLYYLPTHIHTQTIIIIIIIITVHPVHLSLCTHTHIHTHIGGGKKAHKIQKTISEIINAR